MARVLLSSQPLALAAAAALPARSPSWYHGIMAQATTIMFDRDLYEWLRAEAFRQRTSMSRIVAFALLAYKEQQQEGK
jgi:hypothetical protein